MVSERHLKNCDEEFPNLRKIMAKRDMLDNIIGNILNTRLEENPIYGGSGYHYSEFEPLGDEQHRLRMQADMNPTAIPREHGGRGLKRGEKYSQHTLELFRILNPDFPDDKRSQINWRTTTRERFEGYLYSIIERCGMDSQRGQGAYNLLVESLATPYADREPSVPKIPTPELTQDEWETYKEQYLNAKNSESR